MSQTPRATSAAKPAAIHSAERPRMDIEWAEPTVPKTIAPTTQANSGRKRAGRTGMAIGPKKRERRFMALSSNGGAVASGDVEPDARL